MSNTPELEPHEEAAVEVIETARQAGDHRKAARITRAVEMRQDRDAARARRGGKQ